MPPPAAHSTLTGVLERIIFHNEENHYTIAEFRPDTRPAAVKTPASAEEKIEKVTIVGALPSVECGETLHLTGEWTQHSQHGAQFKIAAFKSELPASVYGIRKYLGSGLVPGIGKAYANKIVDALGTDTFRVLSEESGKLRDVPGIGPKRATAIKAAWDAKRTERELYIFLQTYGVTPSQCVKLVERYGAQAKPILLEQPYRVAREIDGIGFKTADRIAINLGFANDAAPRLDAGLLYALETLQEDGHTAYREADLIDYAAELLTTEGRYLEARIAAYELAARLQLSAPEVTDLRGETGVTKQLYQLDHEDIGPFGRQCLLARRLVERGVRFVQIYCGAENTTAKKIRPNWDSHEDLVRDHGYWGKVLDTGAAALLRDLKSRGMLDSTLVICTSEFGRQPAAQGKGRDHNPGAFTAWMAGGGIQGGTAYGSTDDLGSKAAENPAYCYDLHATALHQLGIDHEKLSFYHNGIQRRLTDVHGHVIKDILA